MAEASELLPLIRKKVGDYLYPYGSFPEDDFEQLEGYESEFYSAGSEDPMGDRYRTLVMVSAEKIVPVFLDLCELLPPRVFVVAERASEDLYTERDVFVSRQEMDREQFLEVFKAYEFTFAEDGMLGLGAFAHAEPIEIFLADHKELVLFSPQQDAVLDVLRRHGLKQRRLEFFYERPHTHLALTEYRGLRGPQFDFLHVVDVLRRVFDMALQQDEEENVDAEGRPLGLVPWRAIVRVAPRPRARARAARRRSRVFSQDFLLTAANRREARHLLEARLQRDGYDLEELDELFRVDLESLPVHVRPSEDALAKPGIWYVGDKAEIDMPWH